MAVKLWTLDGTCHQGLLVKLGLHVIPNESLTSKHTLNVKIKLGYMHFITAWWRTGEVQGKTKP